MDKKTIGLIAIGLLVLIAYQKGAFSANKGEFIDPVEATGAPATINDNEAKNLARSFYTTSANEYGTGIFGNAFFLNLEKLYKMPPADTIKVANIYAREYVNSEYKTLRALIASITTLYFSQTRELQYQVMEKLNNLGL